MAVYDVKSGIDENLQPKGREGHSCQPHRRSFAPRWLTAASAVAALTLLHALPAEAQRPRELRPIATPPSQFIPCPAPGQSLIRIPELVSHGGILRGTIVLSDMPQRMDLNLGPERCVPQFVRNFRGLRAILPEYPGAIPPGYQGAIPPTPLSQYQDPVPGPTLRARVGDIVQLTFLNHIDPGNFGDSIDRGERGEGCDASSAPYPGPDTFPDCFHGSSTGNIHFHGTHTTPGTTGDNVFIEVRPSPRKNDQPLVTEASVRDSFDRFFAECGLQLGKDVLSQWPRTWSDLPSAWVAEQENLLRQYDSDPTIKRKLWPVNAQQRADGAWPQYYIGAFPFCFRLPEYPVLSPSATQAAHSQVGHGAAMHTATQTAATEGRALRMGQAPGTHWYHAHKHGSTTINVMNGMTGAFIIEGPYDDALNTFYGVGSTSPHPWTRQQPVLVINELGVSPLVVGGGSIVPFSVNGRRVPKLAMRPGEVQLWRIVNTSPRSGVSVLGFSANATPDPKLAGFSWKQIAQDGVQFQEANYDASKDRGFLMASANRVDLLVKAPSNETGSSQVFNLLVRNAINRDQAQNDPPIILLTVQVESGTSVTGNQSKFISGSDYPRFPEEFLADIPAEAVNGTKRIVFKSGPPATPPPPNTFFTTHTIDGKKFDGNVGQVVLLNTVEEWKIENATIAADIPFQQNIDHPFHIHINPFQVVEEFDPNEPLINRETGRPILDPDSNADPALRTPAPKYVFDGPARTIEGVKQCSVNSTDAGTWKPCDDKWQKPNRIWRDVFPIPSGKKVGTVVIPGYFKMRSRFVDYTGQYVIHCHILAHEDRGMMTIVQVVPFRTPYSHQ